MLSKPATHLLPSLSPASLPHHFTGTYFTAQPFEQRAASWYIPFYFMPGAEEALTANDWKFFRELLGVNASQQQMDAYVERLSQPGAHTRSASCVEAPKLLGV